MFSDTGPVLGPSEELIGRDSTLEGAFGDVDHIDDFFGRPVRLFTIKILPGVPLLAQRWGPWELYMGDPAVKKKLANFNNLRANLRLKFLVNGTPSHVGRFLVSYHYLEETTITIGNDLVRRSQRPNLHLDPTSSQGGEMLLPFFWYERAFGLPYMYTGPGPNNWDKVGTLYVEEFVTLQQNSAGTDPITITCYGTLENVELGVPTNWSPQANWVPQASKKKKKGLSRADENSNEELKVSTVASAIADGADMMSTLPVIGVFAKATSIVARGVGGVAALFGFSRPNILQEITPVRQVPFGELATTTGKEMVAKLTLDPKQELTVDSRVVGLDGTDELSMQFLTRKWSYIATKEWAPTAAVGDTIFELNIDPMMGGPGSVGSSDNATTYLPTILAYVSRMFENWSGDIEVKLEFVMSAYHRGRLSLHYDPNVQSGGELDNVTYTEYIDVNAQSTSLKGGRTATFNVGFKVNQNYLTVYDHPYDAFSTALDSEYNNGQLVLNVATELAVPDGITPIQILIFVRAGENFRLLAPRGETISTTGYHPFQAAPQAEWVPQADRSDTQHDENFTVSDLTMSRERDAQADQHLDLVIGGEHFNSFRQLLKRYCYLGGIGLVSTPSAKPADGIYIMAKHAFGPLMPPHGFTGTNGASFNTDGSGRSVNYVHTTNLSYLEKIFAAWRGSRRLKCTYLTDGSGTVSVKRNETAAAFGVSGTGNYIIRNTDTYDDRARLVMKNTDNCGSAAYVTLRRTLDAIETEAPYYGPSRISRANLNWADLNQPDSKNGLTFEYIDNSEDWTSSVVHYYVATGEDFNFHGFVGAPTYYVYTVI